MLRVGFFFQRNSAKITKGVANELSSATRRYKFTWSETPFRLNKKASEYKPLLNAIGSTGAMIGAFFAYHQYKSDKSHKEQVRLEEFGRTFIQKTHEHREPLNKHIINIKRGRKIDGAYLDVIIEDTQRLLSFVTAFDSSVVPEKARRALYREIRIMRQAQNDHIEGKGKFDQAAFVEQLKFIFKAVSNCVIIALLKTSPDAINNPAYHEALARLEQTDTCIQLPECTLWESENKKPISFNELHLIFEKLNASIPQEQAIVTRASMK